MVFLDTQIFHGQTKIDYLFQVGLADTKCKSINQELK